MDDEQRDVYRAPGAGLLERIEAWTGNPAQLYDITRKDLANMISAQDPIVDAWLTESEVIIGRSVADLLRGVQQ